jgi:hypothetical protein
VVIHADVQPDWVQDFADASGCMVIVLLDGQTLEVLDEDDMRRHGWGRT